jgi:hypothetical protein
VPWNWAQYSQPGFWFDLYDFIGGTAGEVHVNLNGRDIEFKQSAVSARAPQVGL